MKKLIFAMCVSSFCMQVHAQKQTISSAQVFRNIYAIESQDNERDILSKAVHVVPTEKQYKALQDEFIAFIHFGPNTFTKMEWGSGKEDPKIFDLKQLDTDQWCAAMKSAGMKKVIFTAKHHDGFVLWQSRYTQHGIMSTGFQGGQGDILRELSRSCKKYGLKLGVYLSPADLYQIEDANGLYGNQSPYIERTIPTEVAGRPFKDKRTFRYKADDYNTYFLNQLFELLTEYGPIHEVWFDGAHPKTKGGQQYNYAAWRDLISTLAPEAVIFGKEDIRWCGNEAGKTRDTEWNVIPFDADPIKMEGFRDLTDEDLGSRAKLFNAKFLHYQQAETNTSIREGWFYRDDIYQKVRSADDVFDIYERSVGGNSTFLLNIPPNREGRFSDEDVKVLKSVGERIQSGYKNNLLVGSDLDKSLLDNSDKTNKVFPAQTGELIVSLPGKVKLNRFVIQEAVRSNGERIEQHALDVWQNGKWQQVATATNVGYKRILRFSTQETDRIRLRIMESRATPVLANIGAYYVPMTPPELQIVRDQTDKVTIHPSKSEFGWKPHHEDILKNLNNAFDIYYTEDGTTPSKESQQYKAAFESKGKFIKAMAIDVNGGKGPLAQKELGISKQRWKLASSSSAVEGKTGKEAFDESIASYWQSQATGPGQYLVVDLGADYVIGSFSYTPQRKHAEGMMQGGKVYVSQDNKEWEDAGSFEFGNLINDPSTRTFQLKNAKKARFVKIESTVIAGNGQSLAVAELDFFTP
ncbi:MAG: alpha-L-fucosidase [Sphingobacterium sp.]|jgi:alpha-L-fucosidase|nr:alpha-L-fucosidase [Sphingobacterium sp.]